MITMGRVVELRTKCPDEWAEIMAWCTEQFGPQALHINEVAEFGPRALHINEVAEFSPRGPQGGKWLGSYYGFLQWGDVYFRHEEDAAFFMLRWL
jgi:hypothetical protein